MGRRRQLVRSIGGGCFGKRMASFDHFGQKTKLPCDRLMQMLEAFVVRLRSLFQALRLFCAALVSIHCSSLFKQRCFTRDLCGLARTRRRDGHSTQSTAATENQILLKSISLPTLGPVDSGAVPEINPRA